MSAPDVVAFVNARLDEREALARDGRSLYAYEEGDGDGWAIEGTDGTPGAIIGDKALARHIAANDPAHVLREVAAMRAIVALCTTDDAANCQECAAPPVVLRHLATIWSEHADYRMEWMP